MAHSPTLSTLPGELQNHIIAHLDGLSKLTLRDTSRYYRSIIPYTTELLLSAEKASSHLYGCYSPSCLRLRQPWRFADNMRTGRRKRNGKAATTRFCNDCGLTPHPPKSRYRHGRNTLIKVGGQRYGRCKCKRWGLVPWDGCCFYECRWTCFVCFDAVDRLLNGGSCAKGVRNIMVKRVEAGVADERECELVALCEARSKSS